MTTSVSVLLAIISSVGVATSTPLEANEFTVVSWNVGPGDTDPHLTALRVAGFQGVHLWGLCGVQSNRRTQLFVQAAGENEAGEFVGIVSPTAGRDQSCIIYDTTRFDLVRSFELDWMDGPWRCPGVPMRPPLVAHLTHRATGQEFLFMVNRLAGCCLETQAATLNAWASGRTVPIVAVGTYDFQYDPDDGPLCPDGQKALLALIANGVFHWAPPDNPVATLDWDRDIIDDFIFLANTQGRLWGQSHIVVEPGDFDGPDATSDHRPIRATFTLHPAF